MLAYIILVLMGLAFGYLVPGPAALIPLVIPILLFIGTGFNEGFKGELLVRFLIAVAVTIAAVVVGRVVANARGEGPERAEAR